MEESYSQSTIALVEGGRRDMSLARATDAARALRTSLDYLVGLTDDPAPADQRSSDVSDLSYVVVPWVRDARGAAGAAMPVFDESAEFGVAFHRTVLPDWARHDRMVCISVAGDSMEPALRDGDLVALDHSKDEPLDGRVFVVRTEDGVVIRRMRGRPGAWRLTSDNPRYPSRPVHATDRIIGRVAWSGPPRVR